MSESEAMMKQKSADSAQDVAQRIPSAEASPRSAGPAATPWAATLAQSRRMTAQRQALGAAFGPAAAPQRRGVAQRMVVAAAPTSSIDRIIAADVAFQLDRAGGSAVALKDISQQKAGTYSVADSEWIVVCGHGNTSAIDGVTPENMSGYLKKVTNHAKAGGVYLSACNSATIDDKGTSFLKRFQADFSGGGQGPQPHIVGATGYKINDFDEVSGEQQVAVPTQHGNQAVGLQSSNWAKSGLGGLINAPLGASSIDDVVKQGQALLANTNFRQFFQGFISDLQKANLLEPDQLVDQKGRSIDLR